MNNETTAQRNGLRRTGQRQRRSTRFKVLVGVGSFVAIILLALVVEAGLSYNKVHAGVSVTGLDLGGLTRDEAVAALAAHVSEIQASPIKLTSATKDLGRHACRPRNGDGRRQRGLRRDGGHA